MNTLLRKMAFSCVLAACTAALVPACDGGGDGDTGGDGGSTTTAGTGGGGPSGRADGQACTASAECASGFCLTQAEFGFPNGYCTGACNSFVACAAGSECIDYKQEPFCFKACSTADDCGSGQQCRKLDSASGALVCGPGCTADSECEGFGVCDENSGFCVIPEDCDTEGDEDGDGLADCEDGDCAEKCQADIDKVCGGAVPLDPNTVQSGDNSDGSALLSGTCSGSGNKEDIYKVVLPADQEGILDVSLVSDVDLALWAETTCGMPSEVGCKDAVGGGAEPETLHIGLGKGQTVFVVVDGSSFNGATGNQGAYTLTTQFLPIQPETEPNDDQGTASLVSLATLPTVATGELDQAADNDDWFAVDTSMLAGNKTITAETFGLAGATCAPSGDVDTYLEIVAEAGTVLDPADPMDAGQNEDISGSSWCSLAEITDAPPGKYFLHVRTSTLCVPDPNGPDCAFKYGIKLSVQ